MARVELIDLCKSYGRIDVIKGVNLHIKHGEFCTFVGPSGCGKSTLLRIISGLDTASAGDICLDGERVNHLPASDRGLAMVFQSYALYPHMTVRQNLSFGLENIGTNRYDIEHKIQNAAKMLQIDHLLLRRPKDLSGGQRQRVAIGRAVVRAPRVFLFDEPLSNLDAELRVDMRREIAALHKRLGNTMIYVTHDQVEAMTMADKIAVLRDGCVEQFGSPLALFNTPQNVFVAGFIGSPRMNFVHGVVHSNRVVLASGGAVRLPEGVFSVTENQNVVVGVRPEAIVINTKASEKTDAVLSVDVRTVEKLGSVSYVYGALADGVLLTLHIGGQPNIEQGQQLSVRFDPKCVHVFDQTTGQSLR